MMKRSYFADALDLYEVWATAWGQELDHVHMWRQRAGDEEGAADIEDAPAPKTKRRRRRRPKKKAPDNGATESA